MGCTSISTHIWIYTHTIMWRNPRSVTLHFLEYKGQCYTTTVYRDILRTIIACPTQWWKIYSARHASAKEFDFGTLYWYHQYRLFNWIHKFVETLTFVQSIESWKVLSKTMVRDYTRWCYLRYEMVVSFYSFYLYFILICACLCWCLLRI